MPHRILCTIGKEIAPEAKRILDRIGTVDYLDLHQKELERVIGKYTIAIVQLGLRFDEAAFKKAPHLKLIATATTSADHIDAKAAKKHGVAVLSLKGATTFLRTIPSTAEHTWGLLLALMRKIVPAANAVQGGRWESPPFRGHQLKGKTLGILGVGRLGTMVAHYGKAFGMKVIGSDTERIPKSICKQVGFLELLKESDILSVHVHLTEKTEGMLGSPEFRRMKKGAVIVNTARGKIIDEVVLLKALKRGHFAGYAADVLAGEVMFGQDCSKDPLVQYSRTHDNVLLTPHIGGRTSEAREATDVFIAKKVREWAWRMK